MSTIFLTVNIPKATKESRKTTRIAKRPNKVAAKRHASGPVTIYDKASFLSRMVS